MEIQFEPWQKELQEVDPAIQEQKQQEEWEACSLES